MTDRDATDAPSSIFTAFTISSKVGVPQLSRWPHRKILEFRATSDLRAVVPFITAQIVCESDVSSSELARRFASIHYVRAALFTSTFVDPSGLYKLP
jgi:hypothetical protein